MIHSRCHAQSSAILSVSLALAIGGNAMDAATFCFIGSNPHQLTEVGKQFKSMIVSSSKTVGAAVKLRQIANDSSVLGLITADSVRVNRVAYKPTRLNWGGSNSGPDKAPVISRHRACANYTRCVKLIAA